VNPGKPSHATPAQNLKRGAAIQMVNPHDPASNYKMRTYYN
jgi:hypothetical protein